MESGLPHGANTTRKIGDAKYYTIPPTRLLLLPVRHRPRSGCLRAAEQNLHVSERDARERRQLLMYERKAKMSGVKRDGTRDILDEVSDAMNGLHGRCWHKDYFIRF
jgi:hypothetical protein